MVLDGAVLEGSKFCVGLGLGGCSGRGMDTCVHNQGWSCLLLERFLGSSGAEMVVPLLPLPCQLDEQWVVIELVPPGLKARLLFSRNLSRQGRKA